MNIVFIFSWVSAYSGVNSLPILDEIFSHFLPNAQGGTCDSRPSDTCVTGPGPGEEPIGTPCTFPFLAFDNLGKPTLYYTCTVAGGLPVPWCATQVDTSHNCEIVGAHFGSCDKDKCKDEFEPTTPTPEPPLCANENSVCYTTDGELGEGGELCWFPFNYNGLEYRTCSTGGGYPEAWCPTLVDDNCDIIDIRDCDPSCPNDHDSTSTTTTSITTTEPSTTTTMKASTTTTVHSDEDNCGIYPSCHQYGDGSWQILEDCHKYIICETVDGEMKQTNTECENMDQVFANEYGRCVDWEMATECKTFQEDAVCLAQCPRVMLVSYGPGLTYQERRTGCFRIAGSLFGGTLATYQNMHMQYLTPDATSTPFKINWIVSETPGGFNGGIKNKKYDYIRCPFDNWEGWEVDKGQGHWVVDETMQTTCYRGDEVAPIPFPTTTAQGPCKEGFCDCMWGNVIDPECSEEIVENNIDDFSRGNNTCSDGTVCE